MRAIDADVMKEKLITIADKLIEEDAAPYLFTALLLDREPTIEPEQRWIPCEERLPEEDGMYFVTTNTGQTQVHLYNHTGNSKEYWTRCNKAWMPLPPAYKGYES